MTVSGTVMSVTPEDDGDTHFDLALDTPYTSMLTSANNSGQHGWLVVEIVPADKPGCTPGTPPRPAYGTYDYGICTGANEPNPTLGTHVQVTGPNVLDEDHGGWAEIHPVWAIANVGAARASAAPSTPTTLAPTPTPNTPTPPNPGVQTGVTIVSVSSPVDAGAYANLGGPECAGGGLQPVGHLAERQAEPVVGSGTSHGRRFRAGAVELDDWHQHPGRYGDRHRHLWICVHQGHPSDHRLIRTGSRERGP
jgi:hypothetical protein